MKKITQVIIFFTAFLFSLIYCSQQYAYALTTRTADNVTISQNEVINESLFIAGNRVSVYGRVNGDIYCAGQTIDITGVIDGDVLCAGQSVEVGGKVHGNVRVAGQMIKLDGLVEKNINMAGQTITSLASASGEMLFAGQNINISGLLAKNLTGAGQTIYIDNKIEKNANLFGDKINIGKNAVILGNLTYESNNSAEIDPLATISGEVKHTLPKFQNKPRSSVYDFNNDNIKAFRNIGTLSSLFTQLIIALLLILFIRESITKTTDFMLNDPRRTFGTGLLIFIVFPLIMLSLILTLIGIPFAVLAIILYIFFLYTTKIFVAIAVGRKITQTYITSKKDSLVLAALIGILTVWCLVSLPFIGWAFSLIVIFWGIGGVYYLIRLFNSTGNTKKGK